jgi:hypothetical protein
MIFCLIGKTIYLNHRFDKILLGSLTCTRGFPMKISFALVITTMLVSFQTPARANTIYPTQRGCRVYDDTSFIGIPGQCGTVVPYYPRKLYVQFSRTPLYYPNYCYCPY